MHTIPPSRNLPITLIPSQWGRRCRKWFLIRSVEFAVWQSVNIRWYDPCAIVAWEAPVSSKRRTERDMTWKLT